MPKIYKKLRIWNGRGWDRGQSLYVCAHSIAHAIRLCSEAATKQRGFEWEPVTPYEIKEYWSEGCWGRAMDGIEPEIGVWETREEKGCKHGEPKRLV